MSDALVVTLEPAGTRFAISADGEMPAITAVCGVPEGAEDGQSYAWAVTLAMHPAGIPHACTRTTAHAPIAVTTTEPALAIPFAEVRGGTLTVTVKTTVGGATLTGSTTAEVVGTNPDVAALRALGIPEIFLQLMTLESTLRQFLDGEVKAGYPLFSQDNRLGVGLGQITPAVSDDQVWSWKVNVRDSLATWNAKKTNDAARLLKNYASEPAFQKLVADYNAARGAGAAALAIGLPPVTEEMLENETARLYNGAPVVGEYVAEVDVNGMLVVDVAADGTHGTARWHQVTGDERRALYVAHGFKAETGDPDYVANVRSKVVA